ncbi:MAG: PhoH family protein [Candidatus Cloacimonetes bacterium]|nr:PhoH family protein [Candidatus Cloacimonadota bacterium]
MTEANTTLPKKKEKSNLKKIFVLDTNILLHSATSLMAFKDNDVVLPIQVIEELDRFKKETNERGRNAREVARILDNLRAKGSLMKGVPTEAGGNIQVLTEFENHLPHHMNMDITDNQILACAKFLQIKNQKKMQVVFVSKDINARIKGDALQLLAEDFESEKINFDEFYQGWKEVYVSPDVYADFASNGTVQFLDPSLFHNEYVILKMKNASEELLGRYDKPTSTILGLSNQGENPWGISAMNQQQEFALDALLDDRIQLVTLVGKAGTGKTLLALAAGLKKAVDDLRYKRMLVSRPIMPLGRDIGYLPGSKEEKLSHWMQPIFDNLSFITDNYITESTPSEYVEFLMKNDKIAMEAITYIRGRSLANQWLIVDEAQNLTPHEVKTIISRAGTNTKVILTGDPYQIDNPYLDPSSNGLTYVVERFKGQSIFAHTNFVKSERSQLAALAVELL